VAFFAFVIHGTLEGAEFLSSTNGCEIFPWELFGAGEAGRHMISIEIIVRIIIVEM
jgi:hypothetical protein